MAYEKTIQIVRSELADVFSAVDAWFDRPAGLLAYRPPGGDWSVGEILEHITLTSKFLLIIIDRWSEKASRPTFHRLVSRSLHTPP